MRTVKLITIDNSIEAHIIKGRLLNEGIDCFLTNENFTNLMPLYNNMLGSGIQIYIGENDFDRARALLADKIEPNIFKLVCQNCGSENIGLGLGKRKAFKIFNIVMALFFFFPMGNLKPKYFCKDCKTEIE